MRAPASGGRRASKIEASMRVHATSCRCGDGHQQLPNCTRDLTKNAEDPTSGTDRCQAHSGATDGASRFSAMKRFRTDSRVNTLPPRSWYCQKTQPFVFILRPVRV